MKCTHDETKAERKPNTKRKGNNKKKEKNKTETKKLSTKKREGLATATAKNKSSQREPKIRQKAAGKRKPRAIIVIITRQRQQSSWPREAVRGAQRGRQPSAYPEKLWGIAAPLPRGRVLPHSLKELPVCLSPVTLLGSHRASCFVVPLKQLLFSLFSLLLLLLLQQPPSD